MVKWWNQKNLQCSLDHWDIIIWQNDNQSSDTNIVLHKRNLSELQHSDSDKNTQLYIHTAVQSHWKCAALMVDILSSLKQNRQILTVQYAFTKQLDKEDNMCKKKLAGIQTVNQ